MSRLPRRSILVVGILLIGAGVLVILNSVGVSRWSSFDLVLFELQARDALRADVDVEDWQSERQALLEQIAQLKGLADENERLREALSFTTEAEYAYTLANVISRDPFSASLVYVDAGTDDGIAVGQPVLVGKGTLIGKVLKVSGSSAVVELTTGDGTRVAVKALDTNATSGVTRGTLGTSLRMEYIRDVQALSVGTLLVTSGLEPLIPQGLVVGTVQKVIDNPDELFAYADVVPAADLARIRIVTILRGI